MKAAKKSVQENVVSVQVVAGKQMTGSVIAHARKIASSKKRSLELAQDAKIVTRSGHLSAHYK